MDVLNQGVLTKQDIKEGYKNLYGKIFTDE
jgi:hypothetical protein